MKIIQSVASIGTAGGVASVIYNLKRELRATGAQVEIIESISGANVFQRAFRAQLSSRIQLLRPDIIHDHGIWLPSNHAAVQVARLHDIPCIISTHGMLEPFALQFRVFKKRLAWLLYQRADIRGAFALHATTNTELKSLRALGLCQPIAVIPLGVDLPTSSISKESISSGKKTLLFLSRLHPTKGILNLIEAWAMVRPKGWKVVIAGPDETNHLAVVRSTLKRLCVEHDFSYVGAVNGQGKWDLYKSADLFVLPTFSENFGLVVAEALSCGVPVITTKGAPWESLIIQKCGWWVDVGVEPLRCALLEAIQLSDSERQAMGARGKTFIETEFSWSRFGGEMHSVYGWMRGTTKKPDYVDTM